MSTKHTPGPWQYISTKHRTIICAESGDRVAECESLTASDARLIASAPDLLAALDRILRMDVKGHELQDRLQFSDSGRSILEQARAAIAKATGEAV